MASARPLQLAEVRYRAEFRIPRVQVAPDGARVVLADGREVTVLNARGAVELQVPIPDDDSEVDGLAVSAGASVVALHQASGQLRVLETDTRQWAGPVPVGKLRDLAIAPSGDTIVVASDATVAAFRPSLEGLWPAPLAVTGCGVATSRLGDEVLVASWDGELTWYDSAGTVAASVATGLVLDRIAASETLDEVALVSESGGFSLRGRDGRTLLEQPLPSKAKGLALSADGALAVVVLANGSAMALPRGDGRRFVFAPPSEGLSGAVLLVGERPDLLLGGDGRRIHYVDRTGNLLWSRDLRARLEGLSASPDGGTIAAVNRDRWVAILSSPGRTPEGAAPGGRAGVGPPPPPPPVPPPPPISGLPPRVPPPPPAGPAPMPTAVPSVGPPGTAPTVPMPRPMDYSDVQPADSIAVLGGVGAGKTVFFAMMSVAFADPRWAGDYHLIYRREGFNYVSTIRLELQKGNWPSATTALQTVTMGATLSWKDRIQRTHARHIVLTDISGEAFRDFLGRASTEQRSMPQALAPALARLAASGGYVLLVDGSSDDVTLLEAGLNFYSFLVLVMLQAKLGDRKPLRRPIAVVFTKYDQMDAARKAKPPKELAREKMPDLFRLLEHRVPEAFRTYAFCSSVGHADPVEPGKPGKIRLPLTPYNVANVIVWVATHMPD